MDREFVNKWLDKLKEYWYNKDYKQAASLFVKTTFYQETPFDQPYTTYEEIEEEWKSIQNQNIQAIDFKVLAIEKDTAIVEWSFIDGQLEFNGIYEIKFNDEKKCIYFKSWEMEKGK